MTYTLSCWVQQASRRRMPLSVRSSTDEGTDPKCAKRDAPRDSQSSPHPFRPRSQGRPAIPSAGGAELPAGKPLRDTAGRTKAVFLLLACCTQEETWRLVLKRKYRSKKAMGD